VSEGDVHEADVEEAPESEEDLMDSIEAPEADIVEQHTVVIDDGDNGLDQVPFDVDEGDAAEQSRVVELDEDDYR
jgi:hypothetical protein